MIVTFEEFLVIIWSVFFLITGIAIGYTIFGKEYKFLGYYFRKDNSFKRSENPIEPQINENGKWDWAQALYTNNQTLEKEYYARPDDPNKPAVKKNN